MREEIVRKTFIAIIIVILLVTIILYTNSGKTTKDNYLYLFGLIIGLLIIYFLRWEIESENDDPIGTVTQDECIGDSDCPGLATCENGLCIDPPPPDPEPPIPPEPPCNGECSLTPSNVIYEPTSGWTVSYSPGSGDAYGPYGGLKMGDQLLAYHREHIGRWNLDGTLDTTFGINGYLTNNHPVNDPNFRPANYDKYGWGIAKVVIYGDYIWVLYGRWYVELLPGGGGSSYGRSPYVARFDFDGQWDTSYGVQPWGFAGVSNDSVLGYANFTVLPDGRTALISSSPFVQDILIFAASGATVDSQFDLPLPAGIDRLELRYIELHNDSIYVWGTGRLIGSADDFLTIGKLDLNFNWDTSYGVNNGVTIVDLDVYQFQGWDEGMIPDNNIKIDSEGYLYIPAWFRYDNYNATASVLCKFTPNGELDASFANNGFWFDEQAQAAWSEPWNSTVTVNECDGQIIFCYYNEINYPIYEGVIVVISTSGELIQKVTLPNTVITGGIPTSDGRIIVFEDNDTNDRIRSFDCSLMSVQ